MKVLRTVRMADSDRAPDKGDDGAAAEERERYGVGGETAGLRLAVSKGDATRPHDTAEVAIPSIILSANG